MGRRLLVVDDEEDVLFVVQLTLEMSGYETRGAASAEQALLSVERDEPDAILLDLRLPGMDGWTFLDRLRERGVFPRIPVILITAHSTPSTMRRALDEGCRECLTKPFGIDDLCAAVDRVFVAENQVVNRGR